jgi:hypothetical protein
MFVQLEQIVAETFKKFREPDFAELLGQTVSQKLKGKFRPGPPLRNPRLAHHSPR